MGLVWYVLWLWLTFEKPSKHPTISARELLYIEQSLGSTAQITMPTLSTTPWKSFFTSMPVYAIIVANFCRSWNFYLLVLFQASYMHQRFGLKTEEVRNEYFFKFTSERNVCIFIDGYGCCITTSADDNYCAMRWSAGRSITTVEVNYSLLR